MSTLYVICFELPSLFTKHRAVFVRQRTTDAKTELDQIVPNCINYYIILLMKEIITRQFVPCCAQSDLLESYSTQQICAIHFYSIDRHVCSCSYLYNM